MKIICKEETRFVEILKSYKSNDNNLSELSSLIDSVSNNTLFPEDELLSEILSDENGKRNILCLSVYWISYWGSIPENRYYGMQNEYSGRICVEIVNNSLLEGFDVSMFDGLIETRRKYGSLQTMHRTLMQTFSGFLFHAIHLIDDEKTRRIDEQMTDLHDEYWYCCPFV